MKKLDAILARQLPDAESAGARISGGTSHGLEPVRAAIRDILAQCKMPLRRPDSPISGSLKKTHARNRSRYRNHRPCPLRGDRLVEIGCIEIYNGCDRQTFHRYIIPRRYAGRSLRRAWSLAEFLASKPLFTEVVGRVPGIHRRRAARNPQCVVRHPFINAGTRPHQRQVISRDRLVDTLLLARRKHPGCPTGSTISATLCDR